jgi:RNA polymerase sigma-70 factor (ECF subfamily)
MRDAPGDVEDLVQETLMAVHTRRATYDRAQPFTPWAFALARYKLIDHWRRRKVRVTLPIDDYVEVLAAYAPEPGSAMDLDRALGTLPERQRNLVSRRQARGPQPGRGRRPGRRFRRRGQGRPAPGAEGLWGKDARPCGRMI